ncbi:MAG TPA: DUF1559 domain-containing protein [Pirellulales bacterium]|jgi:prepilin-type N-terminal cleavage/methylation domain-containing protein|nr:DUF1559 domain-containing protein [Pirellulales bacterium]
MRTAFTLVELLVVMTIMGLLMSLLIPAINSARETGRRTVCLNNLKQLSHAAMEYNARRRELPGYVNMIAKAGSSGTSTSTPTNTAPTVPNRLGTWAMMLFPEIERSDVYQTWTTDPVLTATTTSGIANPATPYISLFVCPSDPPDDITVNPTPLSYVANCGIPDNPTTLTATGTTLTGNSVTVVDSSTSSTLVPRPTNGMFYDRYSPKYSTTTAPIPDVASSLDHIPDGASTTLMFTENFMPTAKDVINGFLYRVYYPPVNSSFYTNTANGTAAQYPYLPQGPTGTEALTAAYSFEADIGFVWDPLVPDHTNPVPATGVSGNDPRRINGDKNRKYVSNYPQTQAAFGYYYSRPSSSHPNGVNVATCGGEFYFQRDDIDYWVYEQLMTPDSKHSQMNSGNTPLNASYVLDENDYR